jgi:TolB protein
LIPAAVSAIAALALAGPAQAAFPGGNGKLAFVASAVGCPPGNCPPKLWTANPDGSARTRLMNEPGATLAPQWSPDGQTLVYGAHRGDGNYDIYTNVATGTGVEQRLTTDPATDFDPAWTPDGQRIVFASNRAGTNDLWVMNADGTGVSPLTSGPASDRTPSVSPDGTKVAFTSTRSDPNPACAVNCTEGIYVMDIDGSDITRVPISDAPGCWLLPYHFDPDWSPDGERLAFIWWAGADCEQELDYVPGRVETIRPDGTGQTLLREEEFEELLGPSWSPDGTRIAYWGVAIDVYALDSDDGGNFGVVTSGEEPDWQPLPVNTPSTHVRPAGASPFRASLVPAYNTCTTPNRTHGPPLAFGSCAPPVPGSSNLTVGVGDGSLAFSRSVGHVRVVVHPGVPGGVDDTDVGIRFSLSNVMKASDLSEYTGELRASAQVRLTDKQGAVSSTTQDFPLEFDVPCVGTEPTVDKSLCELTTTLDSVTPGAAAEGTRAVWALDRLKVYDGGPDGDADTTADNSLFAVQGVFVP